MSQSPSDFSKTTIETYSNQPILFNQTIKVFKKIKGDVAGLEINYDEVKQLCKKLGKMNIFIYVIIDLRRKIKADFLFVMKAITQKMIVCLKRTLLVFQAR